MAGVGLLPLNASRATVFCHTAFDRNLKSAALCAAYNKNLVLFEKPALDSRKTGIRGGK